MFSWASEAPLTLGSMDSRTWFEMGSMAQAVPGIFANVSSWPMAALSWSLPRFTICGTAPAWRTAAAACASVTVTTWRPVESTYEPALRAPSCADSDEARSALAAGAAFADAGASAMATNKAVAALVRVARRMLRLTVSSWG